MANNKVLAIGAHPDDIELGCGGTLARHVAVGDDVLLLVMTAGQAGPGDVSSRPAEAQAAANALGAQIVFGGLTDGELDPCRETVSVIEAVLNGFRASVLYTHSEDDAHQDHRAVAEATLSAARDLATIFHYQAPSSHSFQPTMFVPLEEKDLRIKLDALNKHASQVKNSRRVNFEAVQAAALYWGTPASTKLAEGFEITRAFMWPTTAGLMVGDRRSEQRSFVGPERRRTQKPHFNEMFELFHHSSEEQ